MTETIHFFHTNDIHSHFQYWPRMSAFLNAQRSVYANKGEASFLFDVGDFLDRSNLYSDATLGKGATKLLNEANYDCVTIGNNEGITLSHEDLHQFYEDAKFDVVVCNVESEDGNNPKWLKPYTILETEKGTKIGVIGATAPFYLFYEQLGWSVSEPKAAIFQIAHKLRNQVDILVCLSHLGLSEDELLAQDVPMLDIIFGAHTHHTLEQGKVVKGVLLTGGGKYGQYLGHASIQYDRDAKKIIKKSEQLIELPMLPEVPNEIEFLSKLNDEAQSLLDEPLYQLHKTYTKEWFHYSPLSKLFADLMIAKTSADVALFNAGIFMDDLKKGYVTKAQLHAILPHPINLCLVEITGKELKEVFLQAQNEEWPLIQLKGLGFRGVVVGKLLTYGCTMNERRELIIKGKIAQNDETYRLVTLDMFTFGSFFPSLKIMKKKYILPEFIRDLLVDLSQL